ncbi:MAG: aldehyde dehydrogenase, partial [Geminicoccaceae bacterium]|nr:aldehyde dehydrogenase [Geminicoccaceae bacterium]
MADDRIRVISPASGEVLVERPLAGDREIEQALALARRAQPAWRAVPVLERAAIVGRAVDAFVARKAEIAAEITTQMGRPIRYTPSEVRGFEERARYMIGIAGEALADLEVGNKAGFTRFIR